MSDTDRSLPRTREASRRRVLGPKVLAVVGVGNDMTAAGHPVFIAAVREWLTARGQYREERGNQSLGDILGLAGLNLPSELQPFLRLEPPDAPRPPGWRRAPAVVHRGGLVAYTKSVRVYQWPPTPPGVDRAYLEARFIIPSNWNWSLYQF